jgi:hypothetical protein
LQDTRAGASQQQQNLSPQQEKKLVQDIKEITEQGLPPTHMMIQNFASTVATSLVSTRWVSRFIARHKAELASKWTVGMDRNHAIITTSNSSTRKSDSTTLSHGTSTIWTRRASSLASLQDRNASFQTTLGAKESDSRLTRWLTRVDNSTSNYLCGWELVRPGCNLRGKG